MSNFNSINPYLTHPPRRLPLSKSFKHICKGFRSFLLILIQPLILYETRPQAPRDPPKPNTELADELIFQCKDIYDQAETNRAYIENKARATFAFIAFLTPLLISVFVFLLKETYFNSATGKYVYLFGGLASMLVILSFLSIARAVSVQARERIFLGTIIDAENEDFFEYDKAKYARGFLYCASINEAMNAHIAQFVKGAHVLASLAVLIFCFSAIPLVLLLKDVKKQPSTTIIKEPISIYSPQLEIMNKHLISSSLKINLENIALQDRLNFFEKELKLLQETLPMIDARKEKSTKEHQSSK